MEKLIDKKRKNQKLLKITKKKQKYKNTLQTTDYDKK